MKGLILLDYNEDLQKFEENEKLLFLRNLLEQIGVPIDDIWDDFSVKSKIKLRKILFNYKISINEDHNSMVINVENDKIGEWFKPKYIIKKDPLEKGLKQLYLEVETNCWTIFEKNEKNLHN